MSAWSKLKKFFHFSKKEELLSRRVQELEDSRREMARVLESLKQSEARVEEARSYDEALLGSLADGVFAVNKEGRLTVANPAGERLVGWKFSDTQGKDWFSSFRLVDENGVLVPREKRPFGKVLSSNSHESLTSEDYFYLREDGTKFPVSLHSAPIIRDGAVVGAVGIMRDITHERQIDRAKSEFVSLASHQLRTPLTTIGWYVELLRTNGGTLDKEQQQYVGEVAIAQKRMVEMVDALLNVSRIELGTFVVEPELTKIQAMIDEILREMIFEIETKKLQVVQEIVGDTVLVEADPRLLRIILQNIISNAVKYSAEKGTIRIATKRQDRDLIISVSDTGIGIPENQQAKIFTKLFRADNARIMDPSGSGLGLYIVKSILENFAGRVWFESQEGRGTTLYVALPLVGMQGRPGNIHLVTKPQPDQRSS